MTYHDPYDCFLIFRSLFSSSSSSSLNSFSSSLFLKFICLFLSNVGKLKQVSYLITDMGKEGKSSHFDFSLSFSVIFLLHFSSFLLASFFKFLPLSTTSATASSLSIAWFEGELSGVRCIEKGWSHDAKSLFLLLLLSFLSLHALSFYSLKKTRYSARQVIWSCHRPTSFARRGVLWRWWKVISRRWCSLRMIPRWKGEERDDDDERILKWRRKRENDMCQERNIFYKTREKHFGR